MLELLKVFLIVKYYFELCNAPMVLYNCNGGIINFTYDMIWHDMNEVFAA